MSCTATFALLVLLWQVEEVAVLKHGSLAAVAEQKQQRVRDKIEGRVRRRAGEQQAAQVAAEVAARVQAAVGRHSTRAGGQQMQEEGGWHSNSSLHCVSCTEVELLWCG